MDETDLAVRAAIADPRNERPDGLRAGAKATCGTCDEPLSLVGLGRTDSLLLDWQWQHMVNGNPTAKCDHEPVPLYAHNFTDAGLGVGHIWTNVRCPAYQSLHPRDCTCNGRQP